MTGVSAPPFVLALGDSLTAGYGLSPTAAFPVQLQQRLRLRWPGAIVHNAGVSGDTTQGGLRRLPRLLAGLPRRPDLAIVELGANDLIRGVPPAQTRANLDAILLELGRCGIKVLLATFAPPPFLAGRADRYAAIYAELAARHGVASAPFFPAGVLGHPELVLPDRLHPNARAIALVADALAPTVASALERHRATAA